MILTVNRHQNIVVSRDVDDEAYTVTYAAWERVEGRIDHCASRAVWDVAGECRIYGLVGTSPSMSAAEKADERRVAVLAILTEYPEILEGDYEVDRGEVVVAR
jgi:hypothetical protein